MMTQSILSINKVDIPKEGLHCSIKGYFFYRIAKVDNDSNNLLPACFLSDSNEESPIHIGIPSDIGESVITDDETFGMMVGGQYAYYGLFAEVTGTLERSENGLIFSKVENLKLERDDLFQDFKLS